MATGDQTDMLGRLKSYLPRGWFPSVTPILDGVLSGPANALAFVYSMLTYARLQTRIATVSDGFLDMAAYDFFGLAFQRNTNESDAAFRVRLRAEVLRPRATRAALVKALVDLTGNTPIIFEPSRPADTGAYGVLGGYGVAGRYGSMLMPYQCLVTVVRPTGLGIPTIAGYGSPSGGYGVGNSEYADLSQMVGGVTDAQIYARVASIIPTATIAWTRLTGYASP